MTDVFEANVTVANTRPKLSLTSQLDKKDPFLFIRFDSWQKLGDIYVLVSVSDEHRTSHPADCYLMHNLYFHIHLLSEAQIYR